MLRHFNDFMLVTFLRGSMKKNALIYIITFFLTIEAYAQRRIEFSYDCNVDVELKFLGRIIELTDATEPYKMYKLTQKVVRSNAFTFRALGTGDTLLAAKSKIIDQCITSNSTFQIPSYYSAFYLDRVANDGVITLSSINHSSIIEKLQISVIESEGSNPVYMSIEGLDYNSNQSPPLDLALTPQERKLNINRFCNKLVIKNAFCEKKTIIFED